MKWKTSVNILPFYELPVLSVIHRVEAIEIRVIRIDLLCVAVFVAQQNDKQGKWLPQYQLNDQEMTSTDLVDDEWCIERFQADFLQYQGGISIIIDLKPEKGLRFWFNFFLAGRSVGA